MAITIGQHFLTWEDLQSELQDWAIQVQFEFQKWKKDSSRAYYICQHKSHGCEWRLFASHNKDNEIEVKAVSPQHTCAGMGIVNRHAVLANQQSWLR